MSHFLKQTPSETSEEEGSLPPAEGSSEEDKEPAVPKFKAKKFLTPGSHKRARSSSEEPPKREKKKTKRVRKK